MASTAIETQFIARDLAIGDDPGRVVPHLKAQVETGQFARAHPAFTARDRGQHLGPVKTEPD